MDGSYKRSIRAGRGGRRIPAVLFVLSFSASRPKPVEEDRKENEKGRRPSATTVPSSTRPLMRRRGTACGSAAQWLGFPQMSDNECDTKRGGSWRVIDASLARTRHIRCNRTKWIRVYSPFNSPSDETTTFDLHLIVVTPTPSSHRLRHPVCPAVEG